MAEIDLEFHFPILSSTPRRSIGDFHIHHFDKNLKVSITKTGMESVFNGEADEFRHLYETGMHSDVTLKVGTSETKIFHVHKRVLSMSSRVFKKWFQNLAKEPGLTLRIRDVDAESCARLLRFIYCREFDANEESNITTDIETAKRFDIPDYIQACLHHFEKNLSVENLFVAYDLALKENSEKLKKLSRVMLNAKLSLIIQKPGFYECSLELMEAIAGDIAHDVNPKRLYTVLLAWSQNYLLTNNEATSLQTVFSSFLPHVRFLEMSDDEFTKSVVQCGVVSLKDANCIRNHILGKPWKCDLPSWCLPRASRAIGKCSVVSTPIGSKKLVNSVEPVVQLRCTFSVVDQSHSVRVVGVHSVIRKLTGCKDMRFDKSTARFTFSNQESVFEKFSVCRIEQTQKDTNVVFRFQDVVTVLPTFTCIIDITVVSKDKGRYQFVEGSYQETTVETTSRNGQATDFSVRFAKTKTTPCGLISHLLLSQGNI